jgi:hypothetical protein
VKKNAADAPSEENAVPGTHGPAEEKAAHFMRAIMKTCLEAWPDAHITIFIGANDSGKFNYASNVHRADIVAMIRGFCDRLEEEQ